MQCSKSNNGIKKFRVVCFDLFNDAWGGGIEKKILPRISMSVIVLEGYVCVREEGNRDTAANYGGGGGYRKYVKLFSSIYVVVHSDGKCFEYVFHANSTEKKYTHKFVVFQFVILIVVYSFHCHHRHPNTNKRGVYNMCCVNGDNSFCFLLFVFSVSDRIGQPGRIILFHSQTDRFLDILSSCKCST